MDQGPATAAGASLISLSEIEQKYYSGLYTSCKADSCGRLSASKVAELFRASQLPAETLHQVTEVCGAKRLGYFGVEQFHVALKLLAAAQMGLPVHQGSVKGELPLPIFVGIQNNAEDWYAAQSQHIDSRSRQCGAAPGLASRAARLPDNAVDQQEFRSSPHSARSSSPDSLSANQSSAYSAQRNGTDTLLAQPTHGPGWPGTQSENYSPSHYRSQSSMDNPSVTQARSVERPVDPDVADDPWRITGEQLEYYTYQFKSLQPDLGALILGAVAKNFFTKSKLPILELSHIWELSDTDRDGALSFPEFCTAFHLIVARKNGYPLPESLPPALQPGLTGQDRDPPGPLAEAGFFGGLSVLRQAEFVHVETEPLISFEETAPEPILLEKNRVEIQSPVSETTTPTQELTDGPSKSERGPKKAVETENGPNKSSWPGPARELDPQSRTRLRPRSYSSTSIDDAMKKPPTPPPRPQKTHSRASSLDLNRLLLQSSQGFKSVWLPSPPPPPALPPRPPVPVVPPPATRGAVIPPPATTQIPHSVPTAGKASQKALSQSYFADFSSFRKGVQNLVNAEEQSPPSKPAVGREDADLIKTESLLSQKPVRRKYRPESQNLGPASSSPTSGPISTVPAVPTLGTKAGQKLPNRQPKEIQTAIRKNKETNAVLIRLNTQLQQQLKEVHQERLSLESQLETLKSISFV